MLKCEPGHNDPRVSFQHEIMTPRFSFQWGQNLTLHRQSSCKVFHIVVTLVHVSE